ncbi:TRAP transporter small permease [uncultured Albimonas sp.]|uniref:TRAP transporter small permease n=1 Tax=uncultured Albimonas sp. TaxID=1331701 RepID=UPI0030EDEF63
MSFGRILDRVERAGDGVAALCLIVMMITISVDAIGRFMGAPLQGAYEFSELYLMVLIAFLPLARSLATGGQVRMELLAPVLERIPGRAVHRLTMALALGAFGMLLWVCVPEAAEKFAARETSFGLVQWPLYLSYVWAPVGIALLCVRLAYEVVAPSPAEAPPGAGDPHGTEAI